MGTGHADKTDEDTAEGFCNPIYDVEETLAEGGIYTRCFAVREWGATGWRTRLVKHYTESGINGAPWCDATNHHQTIDLIFNILEAMTSASKVAANQDWGACSLNST